MNTLIKVTDAASANAIAKGAFTVPLFAKDASDDTSPVAYWSSWKLSDEWRAKLKELPVTMDDYDPVSDPTFPDRKLAEWGLRRALPKMP